MSTRAMCWAWGVSTSMTKKVILLALADFADADGVVRVSQQVLADRCSCRRETVSRAIGSMIRDGLIRADVDGYRLGTKG